MVQKNDHTYMSAALEEARKAFERDEVPIGAVLVNKEYGEIEACSGNRTIELCDPTAHAEIMAIRALCKEKGVQRLPEYDLYVTLEPCPMCAAAISFARINTVFFGASDLKSGGVLHGPTLYTHSVMHHKPEVKHGLLKEECSQILKDFFRKKRK